jgi:hypothetical protein
VRPGRQKAHFPLEGSRLHRDEIFKVQLCATGGLRRPRVPTEPSSAHIYFHQNASEAKPHEALLRRAVI